MCSFLPRVYFIEQLYDTLIDIPLMVFTCIPEQIFVCRCIMWRPADVIWLFFNDFHEYNIYIICLYLASGKAVGASLQNLVPYLSFLRMIQLALVCVL